MSVQLRWIVPGRVLYIRLPRVLTVDFMERGFDRLQQLHHDLPVHLVADLHQVEQYPADLLRLQRAVARYFRHAGDGRMLILMNQWLYRYLLGVLWYEYRLRWHVFADLPDALTFLEAVDDSLPPPALPDIDPDSRPQ